MTISPYVPDKSTFSFIVRIFRFLANSSLMSRHFSMTASIVCRSFSSPTLLMLTYLWIVLFYILTDAKSSEDHILGFFSKVDLSSNLATFANCKSRKKCHMTVTTLLVSWRYLSIRGKVMACSWLNSVCLSAVVSSADCSDMVPIFYCRLWTFTKSRQSWYTRTAFIWPWTSELPCLLGLYPNSILQVNVTYLNSLESV